VLFPAAREDLAQARICHHREVCFVDLAREHPSDVRRQPRPRRHGVDVRQELLQLALLVVSHPIDDREHERFLRLEVVHQPRLRQPGRVRDRVERYRLLTPHQRERRVEDDLT